MKRELIRNQFTFKDADGVVVDDNTYPGIEAAMDEYQNKFGMKANAFAANNVSRAFDKIVLAAFIQGMIWTATSKKPNIGEQ